jgi:cysteine desulfuration protein SufE
MAEYPEALAELLEDFAFLTDRNERIEYLIEISDRFDAVRVPEEISARPHPEEHHVQQCESDAYVWAVDQPDGTQRYYFDVVNPQGLSAMAMAVILSESLSGHSPEQIVQVPGDIVFQIFGKEIAMGKGQGLMGMLSLLQHFARQKLENGGSG